MDKDKDAFFELWRLSGIEEHVKYHCDLDFAVSEGDLLIFDEADQYIYEEPQAFMDFIRKHSCLCLTATAGDGDNEAAEKTLLGQLGFKNFENVLTNVGSKTSSATNF